MAASQTRLIIMVWAPQSTDGWSDACKQIITELERQGHTVFYAEQLGVSTSMRRKKGVEYKATDTLDVIVAVQPAFNLVGEVPDFDEFIVADSKMLLFIDQAAPDRHLYNFALAELTTRYNNFETFICPDDFSQRILVNKILAKINVMQTVKYRAIQCGKSWGLVLAPDDVETQSQISPRPFRYNLLELYRLNRDELETLLDSTTLFILAYANHMGKITLRALWQDMKLDDAQMQPRMMRLQHGKLLTEANGNMIVTEAGKKLLSDLGL